MKERQQCNILRKIRNSNKMQLLDRTTQRTTQNYNSLISSANTSFCKDLHTTRNDASMPKLSALLSPHILTPRNQLFRISSQFDSSQQISKISTSKDLPKVLKKRFQNQKQRQLIKFQTCEDEQLQKINKFINFNTSNTTNSKYRNDHLKNIPNFHKQITKIKCKQCENYIHQITSKNISLTSQLQKSKLKYKILQQKYKNIEIKIQQHQNNTNLKSIIKTYQNQLINFQTKQQKQTNDNTKQRQQQLSNKLQQIQKINKYLLIQYKQKQNNFYNQNYQLMTKIDILCLQKQKLNKILLRKDQDLYVLRQQIKNMDKNNTIKERLQMCREQLYSFKIKYQEKCIQNKQLCQKIEEMKKKSKSLSSLIGCAIIFNLNQNQKDQKQIKQFMNHLNKYQHIAHNMLQNSSFQFLKFYQSGQKDQQLKNKTTKDISQSKTKQNIQKVVEKVVNTKTLYYPNFMIFIGENSLSSKSQHEMIKSIVFVRIRAILDSKYIDYRLYQALASNFGIFCYNFIRNYDIINEEKKGYLINRHMSESQIKQKNIDFMNILLDHRIKQLPQIQIFRQFLLNKWQQDQIYFYLMCRHKLNQGSQLQNYINSGDPSKLILFSKAKRIILKITSIFNRNIQNFIYHHINQKKIKKNNNQYIKIYYLLKLLLLIYRKVQVKKILEFQLYFQDVQKINKLNFISFSNFMELMKKNFMFLSKMQITNIYRKSLGIFESQKLNGVTFYESFIASSIHSIFLLELINFDNHLENDCITSEEIYGYNPNLRKAQIHETIPNKLNKLNKLWPDSIYVLGNQFINHKFHYLLKSSNIQPLKKQLQVIKLLVNVVQGHFIKQNRFFKEKQNITILLENTSQILIQYLNKMEKQKIQYEKKLNLSSKKIGKFFKTKLYQFYNEMLQDVNNFSENTKKQEDKNLPNQQKKYIKQKKRVSKNIENIILQ